MLEEARWRSTADSVSVSVVPGARLSTKSSPVEALTSKFARSAVSCPCLGDVNGVGQSKSTVSCGAYLVELKGATATHRCHDVQRSKTSAPERAPPHSPHIAACVVRAIEVVIEGVVRGT